MPDHFSNIRLGFATNSSSSHSIILLPENVKVPNDLHPLDGPMQYGWGFFTLATTEEKQKYVFVHLASGLQRLVSKYEAAMLANALLGTNYMMPWERTNDSFANDFYIDHQSGRTVPRPHGKNTTMQDYVDYLKREVIHNLRVVICGGNDNADESHALQRCYGYANVISMMDNTDRFVTDPLGHMTFFGRGGEKWRTKNQRTGTDPTHSTIPELVDLKITDVCDKGCPWCMEDSTPDGKHADWQTLFSIAYRMGGAGVFEVAIGGGEPTCHPNFEQLLELFHDQGIVSNFSTGTMRWLCNEKVVETVKKCCGAVAFSTQSAEEAREWIDWADEHQINHAVHFIVRLDTGDSLRDMLDALTAEHGYLETRLVLLGLKAQGRYANHDTPKTNWWECFGKNKKHRKLLNGSIAVDSSLVPDIKQHMPDVDPKTYEASDGRFSMYWDAVKDEVGASSHLPKRLPASNTYCVFDELWPQIVQETLKEQH